MTARRAQIAVIGAFDDLRARQLRFLEEAAKLGEVTAWLWTDDTVTARTGKPPKFPLAERSYFLNAVRFISHVEIVDPRTAPDALPAIGNNPPQIWVDEESAANQAREDHCRRHGLKYQLIPPRQFDGFPVPAFQPAVSARKKVVVTGCYDWFHSGHVRFFEEVSAYGELYVIVGHDANIRALKGEGHPLVRQDERRYAVASIRYVTQALITSGEGWLDADPEIQRLKPDIYAVNEDGDKGGKREYCAERGIEYLVLKRIPAPGLPKRTSTDLRGF